MLRPLRIFVLCSVLCAKWLPAQEETLFSQLNAYNPIPNASGSMVAFVRTGYGRVGGTGGFGRSNQISSLAFATGDGRSLMDPHVDAFLDRWIDDKTVSCFRDWRFGTATQEGWKSLRSMTGNMTKGPPHAERATYLAGLKTHLWLEAKNQVTVIQTEKGPLSQLGRDISVADLVIPSPDERYLAIAGNGSNLWIFNISSRKMVDLGRVQIHPDADWDYIKPSWDPWFRDSSRLAFSTGHALYVVWPDGSRREKVGEDVAANLPVPSPDGRSIAYVTFNARPMVGRADLKFWGGAVAWVIKLGEEHAVRVTAPTEDTTLGLRWLDASTLIFDRVSDENFHGHARIWTAVVHSQ